MLDIPTAALRKRCHALHQRVGGRHWWPQLPLAALLVAGGVLLLQAELGHHWQHILDRLLSGSHGFSPRLLPPIMIGAGMLIIAFGLLFRSRLAWAMALLLAATAALSLHFARHDDAHLLLAYFIVLVVLLVSAWRQFDRTSLAAGTLFTLTSLVMVVVYATFGSFYLGAEFQPRITDLVTALYFSTVTMSTVGYGDILPTTNEARLFVVSIIVLGVAVFATSLTTVVAPLVSRSLQRIVNRKDKRMQRANHFVVIGNTPLALNTWRELARRGHAVTRLLRQAPDPALPDVADTVIGDPSDADVLRSAGADKAQAVLAMLDDDSDNAFVVLAVRELAGKARTVAAVNDVKHLGRVRLVQPDVVIAPQILGGELAAMLLTGEEVSADFVMNRLFQRPADADATHAATDAPGTTP